MGSYSFKSSGVTQADAAANKLAASLPVIGILTPLALGSDDLLATSTDLAAQLTDNLRNLILTNRGERLGFYDFGANLRPEMANLVSLDDFDARINGLIKGSVGRWMPYVVLQDFTTSIDNAQNRNTAVILLTITFDVPSLGIKGKKLQVTLYAI